MKNLAVRLAMLLLVSGYHLCLIAQSNVQLDVITSETDTFALRYYRDSLAPIYQQSKFLADQWAISNGYPIRDTTGGMGGISIQRTVREDHYQYDQTDNLTSAFTISTNKVKFGGGQNLDLTGAGYSAYIFDDGAVVPHDEFIGRSAYSTLAGGNGPPVFGKHPTHVGGTIISAGIYIYQSQGHAHEANLKYEHLGYDITHMTTAAYEGAIISNHSYSQTTGWHSTGSNWYWYGDLSISQTEDYEFGFYGELSQSFDRIAYLAPYYLTVKTASNNRADIGPTPGGSHFAQSGGQWVQSTFTRSPDGPYDCLPPRAVAKNNLVVGAVDDIPNGYTVPSDVTMASFSSWGPTDDGRIKPDIVTNGIGILSTINSADYASWSGTSMAAPAATGSIVLLQEHYARTHQTALMRSATARALVIHTADETGTARGPDYQFGWGLMNTSKAAQVITNNEFTPDVLQELVLQPGDTFRYTFQYSGQYDQFIQATIAWTDPPGTPVAPQLDPTDIMLVNDLDLRIRQIGPAEGEFYPWILDPANPASPATKGDNFRDNVEVVRLGSPTPGGTYEIVVSHKGTSLHNNLPQHFSLVLSGIDLQNSTAAEMAVDAGVSVRTSPNPARDHVDFTFFNPENLKLVQLEITTIEGKVILKQQFNPTHIPVTVNTSDWPSGLYLYKVSTANTGYASGKILIATR